MLYGVHCIYRLTHQSVGGAGDHEHPEVSEESADEEEEERLKYQRDPIPDVEDSGSMSETKPPNFGEIVLKLE